MKKMKISELIIYCIIFGLLIEVNVIAHKLNMIQKDLVSFKNSMNPPSLEIGDTVPDMEVSDLNGNATVLITNNSDKDILLLAFGTRCPICVQNLPYWDSLLEGIDQKIIDVFGITLDSTQQALDYAQKYTIKYDVIIPKELNFFLENYKIHTVPQTVMINKNGQIVGLWKGLLSEEKLEEIKRLLS